MLPVDDHLAACLGAVTPLPPESLALLDALGCLLAEDVVSGLDMPRFDNSSMDGYAVVAAELAGASAAVPATMPVSGDIPAGQMLPAPLAPGTVARIMTGAPVPPGADAVVPVEWTDGGTASVTITREPLLGQHIRRIGEDIRTGDLALTTGVWLAARHISLLATLGRPQVLVRRRPRVIVLASGSELVPPGQPLHGGAIHDSNGYGLTAAARAAGADAEHGGIVGDSVDDVIQALDDAARHADLVITSGGVSKGAYDTIKEVLLERGTVDFYPVAMQPGMPQGFGALSPGGTPIFTLPGNPVSALVSFQVFVAPVVRKLAGFGVPERGGLSAVHRLVPAVASEGWRSPPNKTQFTRAVLVDGTVRPVGKQGSHLVADLAGSTCLAIVPPQVSQVEAGDQVDCLMLDES